MSASLIYMIVIAIFVSAWNLICFYFLLLGTSPKPKRLNEPLSICFIHPELLQDEYTRYLVEISLGLQARGHHIEIFTGYHDRRHCFPETLNGTLDIHLHGAILPRSIANNFQSICMFVKFFFVSVRAMLRHKRMQGGFDIMFVSQCHHTIPVLKLSGSRIIYNFQSTEQTFDISKSLADYTLPKQGGNQYMGHGIKKLKALYHFMISKLCLTYLFHKIQNLYFKVYYFSWIYPQEIMMKDADVILFNNQYIRSIFKRKFQNFIIASPSSPQPDVAYIPKSLVIHPCIRHVPKIWVGKKNMGLKELNRSSHQEQDINLMASGKNDGNLLIQDPVMHSKPKLIHGHELDGWESDQHLPDNINQDGQVIEDPDGSDEPLSSNLFDEQYSLFLCLVESFEPHENIELAIRMMAIIMEKQKVSKEPRKNISLCIATSDDACTYRRRKYLNQLVTLVDELGMSSIITNNIVGCHDGNYYYWNLQSEGDKEKAEGSQIGQLVHVDSKERKDIVFLSGLVGEMQPLLLHLCQVLLYTPLNPTLTLLPLAASMANKPVIACNGGCLLETICHEKTGYLLPPDPDLWATTALNLLMNSQKSKMIGEVASKHVNMYHAVNIICSQLEDTMRTLLSKDVPIQAESKDQSKDRLGAAFKGNNDSKDKKIQDNGR